MNDFIPELDAYEREVSSRVGQVEAADARREMESHLAADYEARIELGIAFDDARTQALASLGDLKTAALQETVTKPVFASLALAAPLAAAFGQYLGYAFDSRFFDLGVFAAILLAAASARHAPRFHPGPLLVGTLIGLIPLQLYNLSIMYEIALPGRDVLRLWAHPMRWSGRFMDLLVEPLIAHSLIVFAVRLNRRWRRA